MLERFGLRGNSEKIDSGNLYSVNSISAYILELSTKSYSNDPAISISLILASLRSTEILFLAIEPLTPFVLILNDGNSEERLSCFRSIIIFSSSFAMSPSIRKLIDRVVSS